MTATPAGPGRVPTVPLAPSAATGSPPIVQLAASRRALSLVPSPESAKAGTALNGPGLSSPRLPPRKNAMPTIAVQAPGVIPARGPVAPDLSGVDPTLFPEIDERCIGLDRVLIQLTEVVRDALVKAAPYRDRELGNALRAALISCHDATAEAGGLGVALLELRDCLFPEGAA